MARYRWRDLFRKVLRQRRQLFLAQLAAIFAASLAVPVPLLIPLTVDEVLLGKEGWLTALIEPWIFRFAEISGNIPSGFEGYRPFFLIGTVLLLSVSLRLIALALTAWQTKQFCKLSKEMTFELRCELLKRLERVALSEYETLGSGQVAARLLSDLETLDQFIGLVLSRALVSLLTLAGTAAILLWLHFKLALLILTLHPLVVYFTRRLGERVKRLKHEEHAALERFQDELTETLGAISELRASGRQRAFFNRLIEQADRLRREATQFSYKSDLWQRLSFLFFLHGVDLFRAAAMVAVLLSDLTIGEMLAIFGYLWFLMNPTQELLNLQYAFFSASAALKRLNELFKLREEPHYLALKNPFVGRETVPISISSLHFAYGREEVIRGLELEIAAGEKIALVGESGSGKSTLVQLLLGFYTPQKGTICYGDIPISQIGLEVVRQNVAVVLQHPVILNGTVWQNLALGESFSERELWEALEIAQLREVVERLPEGLETRVGRGGMRLSGGQRQRLAIARMILRRPKVVILDEATSALDRKTERQLLDALDDFLKGRTTIIVAHRPSAIERADRVCFFEDGKISEEGHHKILLRRGGTFARLYGEGGYGTSKF